MHHLLLPQTHRSTATARHEYVSVLRQMLHSPDCALGARYHTIRAQRFTRIRLLCTRESLRSVECSRVEHVQTTFQRHRNQLVHLNVPPIELQTTYAVLHVRLPQRGHLTQIEHLQVSIIVTGCHDTFLVVVRIPEGDRPTVSTACPSFGFRCRADVGHGYLLLSHIPHLHAAIPTARHHLWRATVGGNST